MRNIAIKAASWAQTRRAHQEEEGQTVIEYALVVGLVSLVLIAALVTLGQDAMDTVGSKIQTALTTVAGG